MTSLRVSRNAALASLLVLGACGASGAHAHPDASPACDATLYPCGPYGYDIGSTLADLTLTGRRDTNLDGKVLDDPIQPIKLSDYYQSKKTQVLFISLATVWCGPCANEQPSLVQLYKDYQTAGKGAAFLEAVLQDSAGKPADMAVVDGWTSTYSIPFDMAADPTSALAPYYNPTSFPVQLVVRTSNMSLVYQHTGVSTDLKTVIDGVLANP